VQNHSNGPPGWGRSGSFFWHHMLSIRQLFLQSTSCKIGDGTLTSFWYDPWSGPPLLTANHPPPWPIRQKINIRNAATEIEILLPRPRTQAQERAAQTLISITFTEDPDVLYWKLDSSGIYSAKSFYDFYAGLGKIKWEFSLLWKTKAPPSVRIFYFLLLHDKPLTQQVLQRRKIAGETGCVMCLHPQNLLFISSIYCWNNGRINK
jgi:zinc-binding in reverse transcriptase